MSMQIEMELPLPTFKEVTDPTRIEMTPRAEAVIDFINGNLFLTDPGGTLRPFTLLPFQEDFVRGLYRSRSEQGRDTLLKTRGVLSTAKKNGKTEFSAALVLAHLLGPENVHDGEIYVGAVTKAQAARLYARVRKFVERSALAFNNGMTLRNLSAEVKVGQYEMVAHETQTTFRALASETGAIQGLSPSFFVADELAFHKNSDLYTSLKEGHGAWDEPVSMVISTRNWEPGNALDELMDSLGDEDGDHHVKFYEFPERADVADESLWYLANPAVDHLPSLKRDLAKSARENLHVPAYRDRFKCLRLNMVVNAENALITSDEWRRNLDPDLEAADLFGETAYGGLDLAKVRDLTSFTLYFPHQQAILSWSWLPNAVLPQREQEDRVPYRRLADEGKLLITKGETIDYLETARDIARISEDFAVRRIAYDRHLIRNMTEHPLFESLGVPEMVEFDTGYKGMVPATAAFLRELANGRLKHQNDILLNRAASIVGCKVFDNGAVAPLKKKDNHRIDPIYAAILAVGIAEAVYDTPDLDLGLMSALNNY